MVCFFNNIKNTFIEIKIIIRENKVHFCICLALTLLAIAISLNKATFAVEVYYSPNFYILMVERVFNPVAFSLKIIFLIILAYLLLFLMSMHYIFYLCGYLFIYIGVYFIMLPIFCSGIIDGFSGHIIAIFCYIPICSITVVFFSFSMLRIHKLCNYTCDYKYFHNIRYYYRNVLKDIFYPFSINLSCCFIWWLAIYFILSFTIR